MTDSETSEVSSVLSKKQREWLKGNKDALGSPDRVVRSRIRERYRQAIEDLGLLFRSDEFSSEELMKSVRDNNTSGNGISEAGKMEDEMMVEAIDAAWGQMETATGLSADDFGIDMVEDIANEIQNRHGRLEEKWYPRFAARGAYTALRSAGETDKQARQWIEHHWPDSDETLDLLKETEQFF